MVEVVAASLYEAAVLVLAEFGRYGFADATFGPATRLTVRVKAPEEEHTVAVGKIRSWLGLSCGANSELATAQTPEKSGLPSGVLGGGAERFGFPSGVRGIPGSGYCSHLRGERNARREQNKEN